MPQLTFKLIIFLLILAACTPEKQEEKRPNIVWITSEDNSKHYLKLFDDNGISLPNIEALAKEGIKFNHAFSNAPVCSVARSTIISGCYGPRIGTQYHRKLTPVPMPDAIKMFPSYLREAGYHTTNDRKEDYNIIKPDDVWNESAKGATWRDRKEGQPFFHVFNITETHESRLHFNGAQMDTITTKTSEDEFTVHPYHPDSKLFRYTNAYYRDKLLQMDGMLGEVVTKLEEDGLLDDTFIFYYADHGGVLPGSKGYIYEVGLHVPLVVRIPKNFKHLVNMEEGSSVDGFVSFIDLGATVLNLAGIPIPEGIDGKPFLGKDITTDELNTRDETFSYADRFDEKYDLVRAVRKGKYKYIRNFQPFNYDALMNNYRYKQMAYKEWKAMYKDGKLDENQARFFEKRTPEMLFNVEEDPFETNNLALDPENSEALQAMRKLLDDRLKGMPDLSFYPEYYLVENAFENPVTFGQANQQQISKYIDISNLSLSDFGSVKSELDNLLSSSDPWERYWALIVCCSFAEEAKELKDRIREISQQDAVNINKVRAAAFLGMIGERDPAEVMTKALYASTSVGEALLILNSITLMASYQYNFDFELDATNIEESINKDREIQNRLTYLASI